MRNDRVHDVQRATFDKVIILFLFCIMQKFSIQFKGLKMRKVYKRFSQRIEMNKFFRILHIKLTGDIFQNLVRIDHLTMKS